jgi:hypothetical protein
MSNNQNTNTTNAIQANINNPVFANQYFNGTYDPTQGSVYRTGDVLSNLLDDYTGEEVQFIKVQNQSGVIDGIVYRQKDGELFADCSTLSSGRISIKRFGAKGDGVTDDTLAIQKAFDNLGKTFSTLLLPAGIYRFTSNLVLQGASNINLHFENATLFDAGKAIPLVDGTTGKTPVGIRFSQCSNLEINGLRRNGDVGRSLPVAVTSESARVPSIDFVSCSNVRLENSTLMGLVGPYVSTLSSGPSHAMRASHLRFGACTSLNIINNTVAEGCGGGEIFCFVDSNYITWENCFHVQGTSSATIWSWGKVIDCNWITIRGHKVQTISPGSFIDFLGTNLIMTDIAFNGHSDSKLLDITSEWQLEDRVIENVRVSNCFCTGKGIISAGGNVAVPKFKNIFIDNLKCKDGILNDSTILLSIQNIGEITFNNLDIRNIRSVYSAAIDHPTRDFFHTYHFNNLKYSCDVKMSADVVLHEANGLTLFSNSIFEINTVMTSAVLEIRDRYANYAKIPLFQSRSIVRYERCRFINAKIKLLCNVDFVDCYFYNCTFETNAEATSNYQHSPNIKFNRCEMEYTDGENSNSADGFLFLLRSLHHLDLLSSKLHGRTENTGGNLILTTFTPIIDSIVNIDDTIIDLERSGATNNKYPGLLLLSNNHGSRKISITNCIFESNMYYILQINGTNVDLPIGLVEGKLINNRFLSVGNTPIYARNAADVSRVSLTVIGDSYLSAIKLEGATNFHSFIVQASFNGDIINPENVYDASQGSTYQSTTGTGVMYIKQTASGKTGWRQLSV